MSALDKALDSEPCLNHDFVQQGQNLIQQKLENPAMRVTKVMKEQVQVTETKRQGLRKPKRKFLTVEAYERKYGSADASKVKTQRIDGQEVRGIDVVDQADIGVFEYIDEMVSAVERQTMLSDPDLVVSSEQGSTIFNAASKYLAAAPKDDSVCTVVNERPSSSSGPPSTTFTGAMDGDQQSSVPGAEAPLQSSCCCNAVSCV